MKKRLTLRRETLTELLAEDLMSVVGGSPTVHCTNECTVGCTATFTATLTQQELPQSFAVCNSVVC